MSSKILEPFLSKLGEIIADRAFNRLKVVPLETLEKNLKILISKACDVEKQIKHAECSGKKKRKREVEEWLEEVKSVETEVNELGTQMESEGFVKRLMDGGKATQLNELVEKLVEQSKNFGELVIDSFATMGVKLMTSRMVGNAFDKNLGTIWRHVENGQVLSIGIHGMGGVGKTTLAKVIYNRLLEASQGSVFWVTVSQEFTIKSLQDKIGRLLNLDLSHEDEEDMRAGILHRTLSKMKNVVLIFDDVWRYIDLSKVGCSFSEECCRLIMTSRSLDVCRQIGCQEVIGVQNLVEYEAWDLFHQTFTHGKMTELTREVEEIAKSMAKCCDGLPLAIISLAASMRGQTAIHTWRNDLEKLKKSFAEQDGMREGQVFELLKYSFDRLHENSGSQSKDFNLIQLCFLYLSLYPEDEEVERNQLIRAFISEGLLDTKKRRRAQYDEGQVILDKLVNVCLLERVVDYEGVECVKMHDLVRGMALKIVGGKYLVRAGEHSLREIPKVEEWTEEVEKVSLMDTDIRRIENGTSPNCPNLSTLILIGSGLEFIPDSFFSKMQGLCHLDLCMTQIRRLPDSLSNLKNLESLLLANCNSLEYVPYLGNLKALRELDLYETAIRELPDSLSNLKKLQSLLLGNCRHLEYVPYLGNLKALRELDLSRTSIKETPQGLDELLNLKFLSLERALKLVALPRGVLPKLVNLQHLSLPRHLEAVDMEEMEMLTQLEEFRGHVKNVHDFNCIASWKHVSLYAIVVGLDPPYLEIADQVCNKGFNNKLLLRNECFLEGEKLLGQGIEVLIIESCSGMSKCLGDHFSTRPRNLRRLSIEECGGIEWIWRSEELVSAPQELESPISSLQHLDLRELEELKGLIDTPTPGPPQGVFSSLTCLMISECNKMRKLGLPAWGFPNLEIISIRRCREIEEIFGEGGCVTLPKLQRLRLFKLPRLENVCGAAAMICNSIKDIGIEGCPRLMKKLPVHLDVPLQPTLRRVKVDREWWESLEWDNPQLPHLLQSSGLLWVSGVLVSGFNSEDEQSSSDEGDAGYYTADE